MFSKYSIVFQLVLILILLCFSEIKPQEINTISSEDVSLFSMSLEELMDIKVDVATKSEMLARETPGIISLITKDEIKASGARDLIDIMRLVPGFDFGIDVRGVTSFGIRGNWAHEGKVLILWDDQIINEVLFGTVQIGNHYPIELIEKIEIIRGPGSAVYGNYAELGVINIVTTAATKLNGAYAGVNFGWMEKATSRQTASFALAKREKNYNFDISLFSGTTIRSDRMMTDYNPQNPYHNYDMEKYSSINPFFLNIGAGYNGVQSRLIIDRYQLNDRTMYGTNLNSAPRIDFISYLFSLQYKHKFSNRFSITPRIEYNQNTPWNSLDQNYETPIYLDKWADRKELSLQFEYNISDVTNILGGVKVNAYKGMAGDSSYYSRDVSKKTLKYSDFALYAQGVFYSKIANFTLGVRYEKNSEAGSSFVPRAAVTKEFGSIHFKLLYSFAFRAPSIENISRYASTPIEPEKTRVFEFETGYRFSKNLSLNANFFNIILNDPIIFFVDPVFNFSAYNNGPRTGSTGLEAELKLKTESIYTVLGYSYYKANKNEVPEYTVNENEQIMLAFPQHKITANCNLILLKGFSVNATATYFSERYADNDFNKTQFKIEPSFLFNIFVNFENFLSENLSIGAGVYNLFNENYQFIQPYNGGSSPLPGPSREIMLRISYGANFN